MFQQLQITIEGTVQGVGFRPFVYELAQRHAIRGSVENHGGLVSILAAAEQANIERFLADIRAQPPILAHISAIHQEPSSVPLPAAFQIITSSASSGEAIHIPPDVALCADCQQEMLDPDNRRYLYPFINCINCGPRLTIINSVPYDRPRTSMADFPMCAACQREYNDPSNRRFHAQPIACPDCGPQLSWQTAEQQLQGTAALEQAVHFLSIGKIIVLRGMGGMQLVCDATLEQSIATLRIRKNRADKPFAVMAADIDSAQRYCHISAEEKGWLQRPEHPILLLARTATKLPANLAPAIPALGLMLPTTPLHHLLFQQQNCPELLVMTSGNSSGDPIGISNEDALDRLEPLTDGFLLHNREILTRVDDSVAMIEDKKIHLIRRARGFVPSALTIPWSLPPLLACGPQLKNTITLAKEQTSWTSQHIGDLSSPQMLDFFTETIYHFQKVLEIAPQLVVCDLHPNYQSSLFAKALHLPLARVQHHHAHAVAIMAEHGITEPVLAIVLDGAGLGADDTIWGGEILRVEADTYQRLACLEPLPLPGGDAAAEQPWRMALAALFQQNGILALQENTLPDHLCIIPAKQRQILASMLTNGFNSPLTSSCGRLFDSVAGLLGTRLFSTFEGQAAMELESLAHKAMQLTSPLQVNIKQDAGLYLLESTSMAKELLQRLGNNEDISALALAFHHWLMDGLLEIITQQSNGEAVVLAGGCLQNRILLKGLRSRLEAHGMKVYSAEKFPVNDGGLSLGQAVIGGLQYVSGSSNAGH